MMKSKKYRLLGIAAPGRVNVFLDGRFRDVNLEDLDDRQLDQLASDGCTYLQLTHEGYLQQNKEAKAIKPEPVAKPKNSPAKRK